MSIIKQKLKLLSTTALFCVGLIFSVFILSFGIQVATAAWEEPSAEAPSGNIFTPLNIGPDYQAKQGRLMLNALVNPFGDMPTISRTLEVAGPKDSYINNLEVDGVFSVDTDTLYVDPTQHYVGIGDATPSAKLDIAGGTMNVGTAADLIAGTAIEALSTGSYAIYGQSLDGGNASLLGTSTDGIGVFGVNTASGVGVYAKSSDASAIAGSSDSIYDPSNVVAGIYGRALGLGAWAGYFEQRLYGTDQIVGRKFVPSRLQDSQIPYTVGWEVERVEDSRRVILEVLAFDGRYLWGTNDAWSWGSIFVIDPDNMEIVHEVSEEDMRSGSGNWTHAISKIIYGGGYIWVAHNISNEGAYITRFNTSTYDIEQVLIDPYIFLTNSPVARDMYYDDQTAGGPYLWVINDRGANSDYPSGYSITQISVGDDVTPPAIVNGPFVISDNALGDGNSCLTFSYELCTDRLNNDADGLIDNGLCVYETVDYDTEPECYGAGGTWSTYKCSDPRGYNRVSCEDSYGGTWDSMDGLCSDRSCDNQTACVGSGVGECDSVWAPATCSSPVRDNQPLCETCAGGGTWESGACIGQPECTTEEACVSTFEDVGTWKGPDTECADSAGTDPGVDPTADERLFYSELGRPTGITGDGDGNIWVSFSGYTNLQRMISVGEGFAKFNAADPTEPTDQYVYCSGPARSPRDIEYDNVNNWIWSVYSNREPTPMTFRGLIKIHPVNGNVIDSYTDLYSDVWNYEHELRFYDRSPGGPSLWVLRADHIYKINPLNPDTGDPAWCEYDQYVSTINELDFDTRDINNPVVWAAHGYSGGITKRTMTGTCETEASLIGASGNVRDMLFDGTNIWLSNDYTTTYSKFRAEDSRKINDYSINARMGYMVYDGQYVWTQHHDGSYGVLEKIDAATSQLVGTYDLMPAVNPGIVCTMANDLVFDGTNIWMSCDYPDDNNPQRDQIAKVDISTCGDPVADQCTIEYFNYIKPRDILYDGQDIWLITSENDSKRVFRIDTDGNLTASLTVEPVNTNGPVADLFGGYIQAMEYDGTYLWLGTLYVDNEGNSVYKVDPRGGYHLDPGNPKSGICSDDSTNSCNFDTDCVDVDATCNAVIAQKYPIYHNSGICSVSNDHCMKDADCPDAETCNGMRGGNVTSMTFDGTNMWVAHKGGYGNHVTVAGECDDGLDNDGNGLCDWDGAVGSLGCSGKPDPGCSNAADGDELPISSYQNKRQHLTRINVATDQIIESIPLTNDYFDHYPTMDTVFDGTNLWLASYSSGFDGWVLAKYYTGSGTGVTDLGGSVKLQSDFRTDTIQPGGFAMSGSAAIGANLIVVGDLVVQNNTWGGAADNVRNFGTGCDDGEFAKGVGLGGSVVEFGVGGVVTGDSASRVAIDVAVDEVNNYMYIIGYDDTPSGFRIEKHEMTTGDLVDGFGTGGVVIENTDYISPYDFAIDLDYMYIVGRYNGDLRIEKRSLATGALCTAAECGIGFGYDAGGNPTGDGIVTGASESAYGRSIAIDSTYMYVVGKNDPFGFRLEKRLLSTGSLDTGFIISGGSPMTIPREIAIDTTDGYMYLTGYDDFVYGRIEKRYLSNGSYEISFGTSGILTQSYDHGSIDRFPIAIDSTYLYVASKGDDYSDLRIEKRLLSTGNIDAGFGLGGYVTTPMSTPRDFKISNDYMYVVGGGHSTGPWLVEKRRLGDGSFCTDANPCDGSGFGYNSSGDYTGDGTVRSGSASNWAEGIAIDSTYIYVVGDNDSPRDWRTEKRQLLTGALGNLPTGSNQLQCRPL